MKKLCIVLAAFCVSVVGCYPFDSEESSIPFVLTEEEEEEKSSLANHYRVTPDGLTVGYGLNAARLDVYNENASFVEGAKYHLENQDGSYDLWFATSGIHSSIIEPYSGYEYQGKITEFPLVFDDHLKGGEYTLTIPAGSINCVEDSIETKFTVSDCGAFLNDGEDSFTVELGRKATYAVLESTNKEYVNFNGKKKKRIRKSVSSLAFYREKDRTSDVTVSFYNDQDQLVMLVQLTPSIRQ